MVDRSPEAERLARQRVALEAAEASRSSHVPRTSPADRLREAAEQSRTFGNDYVWHAWAGDVRRAVAVIEAAKAVHDARMAGRLEDGCAEWIRFQHALQAVEIVGRPEVGTT